MVSLGGGVAHRAQMMAIMICITYLLRAGQGLGAWKSTVESLFLIVL